MKGFPVVALAIAIVGCATTTLPKVSPQKGLNTRADVVGSLRVTGVDVKAPVTFLLYLRLPTFADAQAAMKELRRFCQRVDLKEESTTAVYCIGRKTLVPDSDETEAALLTAKELAAKHNGSLESWEVDFGR